MQINLTNCTLVFMDTDIFLNLTKITYKQATDLLYEQVGYKPTPINYTVEYFYTACECYLKAFGRTNVVYKVDSVQVKTNIKGYINAMNCFR